MTYLLWSFPIVLVVALIASGRVSSAFAGFCGFVAAGIVSLTSAPIPYGPLDALRGAALGGWLAVLVGAVILGGLFFREVVSGEAAPDDEPVPEAQRRRRLFNTCFLVGPFAEAATGFGVGQVAIAPVFRKLALGPMDAVLFGLFSQILVPWGAMANGTIVGAELAALSPADLGVHSALLTVPLLLGWLVLFWRMAARAGIPGAPTDLVREGALVALAAALLVAANAAFGPEVAALAALGPLIAARFWIDERPDGARWRAALRASLPYGVLIVSLATTRAVLPLNRLLGDAVTFRPFAGASAWHPLLHPSSWLVAIGIGTAVATGRAGMLLQAIGRAWERGRKPVVTIVCFLAMAQVMATSGMADGLAQGLRATFGIAALLATPLLAGLFGFLTSSGNAANGLLMSAQAAMARDSHLSVAWVAAIQATAASALTMLSPVRLAMGCALAGDPGLERPAYRRAWPLGALPLLILMGVALWMILS